jgi:amidohydrolase
MVPVTFNHPSLTERMVPTLQRVLGAPNVRLATPTTTAEDFSFFQQAAPGLFVFLGVTPTDQLGTAAPNHSPKFQASEEALVPGMRVLDNLAVDFLTGGTVKQ